MYDRRVGKDRRDQDILRSRLIDRIAVTLIQAEFVLAGVGRALEGTVEVAIDLLHDRDVGQMQQAARRHGHVLVAVYGDIAGRWGIIQTAMLRRAGRARHILSHSKVVVDADLVAGCRADGGDVGVISSGDGATVVGVEAPIDGIL